MKEAKKKIGRRTFIGRTVAAVGALQLMPHVANSAAAQVVPQKPIDENSAKAKTFGYYHEASKVDTEKYPKRKGPEGEKQFCSNCQLLTKSGIALEGHPGQWGVCALFTDGLVSETGWCNSWVQKQPVA